MSLIKWDYLTVIADVNPTIFDVNGNGKHGLDAKVVNKMLAQFGTEGWKLVNTTSINAGGTTTQFSFIFKKIGNANTASEYRRIGFGLDGDGQAG
jgi:hypothetical protein